jgi:alpha-beta hydrolase superfamily lysophospholipase
MRNQPGAIFTQSLHPDVHDLLTANICRRLVGKQLAKDFEQLLSINITKKDVTFRSANGRLLHGWFLELPGTRRVFLYSHGKGNNIYGKIHIARNLLMCGGSVLMYDYQGYGLSEGRASVEGACDDAVAAYDYLRQREHRDARDIIAFGESLGTGITGQLIQHREVGGVILHSGFVSLISAGREMLPWLRLYPDCVFPHQILDNDAVFSKPHPPLCLVHGQEDKTISFTNAEELYKHAAESKTLVALPGVGHCSFGRSNEAIVAINRFLKQSDL